MLTTARRAAIAKPFKDQLPKGLVGLWRAARVQSSLGCIPNEVVGFGVSHNLFRAPRRLFNDTLFYSKSGATVTDNAAAGPDGKTEASTAVCTGNWYIRPATGSTPLTSGSYTVAIWVKRNTGSDQQFCFSTNLGVTRQAAQTATANWQRFTYSFSGTPTSDQICICSIDGTTGANIQICDFELFSGSAALHTPALSGHLFMNGTAQESTMSVSGGVASINGGRGLMQWDNNVTFTNGITCIVYAAQTGTGDSYPGFFSKQQGWTELSVMPSEGTPLSYGWYGSTQIPNRSIAGYWVQNGKGYTAHVFRYDGSRLGHGIGGAMQASAGATIAAQSGQDFVIGRVTSVGTNKHAFTHMAVWNRSLSTGEIEAAVRLFENDASKVNVSKWADRILIIEGDSITGATGTYAWLFASNDSPECFGYVYAVSGSTLADVITRRPNTLATIPANMRGRKYIYTILIGANDLGAYSTGTAGYIADLQAHCLVMKRAGFRVGVGTILPINGNAAHNTRRATVNTDITANWVSGGYCDFVFDFAGDATMGPDAAAANLTYYSDGTHPTATGQGILEGIYRAAVNAI